MDLRDLFPLPLPLPGTRPRGDRTWRDPETGEPLDVPGLLDRILNPPPPPPPPPPLDAQPEIFVPNEPPPGPVEPPIFVPNEPPPGPVSPIPYPLEKLPPRTGPPTLEGFGIKKFEDPDPRGRRTRRELERAILRDGARRGEPFYDACEDLGYGGGDSAMEYCDTIVPFEEYERLRRSAGWPDYNPLGFVDSGVQTGPVTRGIGQLLKRVLPRIVPRKPIRRRRIEPTPRTPRRPRRTLPPEPAPVRPIPRVIPGNPPDWTSPFPKIEPRPQKLPRPTQPEPLRVPTPRVEPARPGEPTIPPFEPAIPRIEPRVLPIPSPSSPPTRTPPPQRSSPPRPARQPARQPQPRTWPFTWPFTTPGPGRPQPWRIPFSDPISPSVENLPLPNAPGAAIAPVPLPLPSPFSPPLTALNPSPVRCAPCPTSKRKQRRKCRASAPVRWAGGPRKGELAGHRCYSFWGG